MGQLQQMADLGNQSRAVATNTPAQDDALQSSLDRATLSGDATAAQEADKIREMILKKQAAFSGDDPAGAALSTSPAVSDAWNAWQQAPTDKGALREAIALTQTEQERQGVPAERRKAVPDSVATAMAGNIMSQPTPKAQLDALLQFADFGDPATSNAVLAQLTALKAGGLPSGADLVVDIASTDRAKAERIWTAMRADTKGIELSDAGKKAVSSAFQDGLGGVLQTQADITGNYAAATDLATSVLEPALRYAKAQAAIGIDAGPAGKQAIQDLTGQYATLNVPNLAAVYYPKQLEAAAPSAVEAGLIALRSDAAEGLRPHAGPLGDFKGLLVPGNIDLTQRPQVQTPEGVATVRSMSFEENGQEILVPTVAADGSRILSDREAIEQYHRTGQYLGIFDNPEDADAYAEALHEAQAQFYANRANPYIDATVRDIKNGAVWVNHGSGFALIVPGSNRALAFTTYDQAQARGVKELAADRDYLLHASQFQMPPTGTAGLGQQAPGDITDFSGADLAPLQ
jgi:hypothetical protein